jgi:O-6-methylguanine DNA methyltransferase
MQLIEVSAMETPFGWFFLASDCGKFLATDGPRDGSSDVEAWARWHWDGENISLAAASHDEAHRQIDSYFSGHATAFDVLLDMRGPDLHVRMWLAATEIPYASTRTYGDLAWDAGFPGAARAAGRAMSVCPLPLFVPCHRVIGAGGQRRGELSAWERRTRLLDFERRMQESKLDRAGVKARRPTR